MAAIYMLRPVIRAFIVCEIRDSQLAGEMKRSFV